MKNLSMRSLLAIPLRVGAALVLASLPALPLAAAEPARARSFDTLQQAVDALVQAAASADTAALIAIFGPEGKDIVSTGDAVADKNRMLKFAELAKQKLEVAPESLNKATVVVGPDDWPMPVPVVRTQGKWRFDAKAGRREILARRIGGNELDAIELLRGYVEAQQEYASVERDGSPMRQYAQKFLSTRGKHDGLSWWNEDGTPGGPFGEGIAKALAEGYTDKTKPFNGYYFRILTAQGPAARLGARNYVVKGMMIGGFAAVAWPANYGVTGIQTFQVNNDGIVYQKDLGPDTARLAAAIKQYDPDKTWMVTEDSP
jgi:Protein of unknown function (DUF2950)